MAKISEKQLKEIVIMLSDLSNKAASIMEKYGEITEWQGLSDDDVGRISCLVSELDEYYDPGNKATLVKFGLPVESISAIDKFYDWDASLGGYE